MNNKLFIFLVVVLLIMIIASSIWLVMSINKYNGVSSGSKEVTQSVEETKQEQTEKEPETQVVEATKAPSQPTPTAPVSSPAPTSSSTANYILPSDTREINESDLIGMDYKTAEALTLLAGFYFVILLPVSVIANIAERRLRNAGNP